MKHTILSTTTTEPSNLFQNEETVYYILGLSPSTTDSDLFSHFESCGRISSIKFLKKSSGNSKKSAILKIKPSSPDAVLSLNKSVLNSKKIKVRLYSNKKVSKVSETETRVIFVGNIPCLSNEDSIGSIFEQYGEIKEIRILKTPDGKTRGLCYVEFTSTDSAHKALEMNEKVFEGKVLRVDLAEEKLSIKTRILRPYNWTLEI